MDLMGYQFAVQKKTINRQGHETWVTLISGNDQALISKFYDDTVKQHSGQESLRLVDRVTDTVLRYHVVFVKDEKVR